MKAILLTVCCMISFVDVRVTQTTTSLRIPTISSQQCMDICLIACSQYLPTTYCMNRKCQNASCSCQEDGHCSLLAVFNSDDVWHRPADPNCYSTDVEVEETICLTDTSCYSFTYVVVETICSHREA